ncbi:MAG: TVP38/TMEM64 family protein [Acidiferrobacterales bacterium]
MSADANSKSAGMTVQAPLTTSTTGNTQRSGIPWARIGMGVAIIGALTALYALLSWSGALDTLTNGPLLRERIEQLGWIGPLAVIVLMTGAIVLSPIPSAPIALAAGAAYGHTWGTIYVLIGAEAGALVAFTIARVLGCDVMQKFCRQRSSLRLLGSQNALMAIVFFTRLLPFISFDVVSYAAGLTPLNLWRFAAATLAGIVPASFVLAHFGAEMVAADTDRIAISVLALGAITLIPIAIKVVRDRRRKGTKNNA